MPVISDATHGIYMCPFSRSTNTPRHLLEDPHLGQWPWSTVEIDSFVKTHLESRVISDD